MDDFDSTPNLITEYASTPEVNKPGQKRIISPEEIEEVKQELIARKFTAEIKESINKIKEGLIAEGVNEADISIECAIGPDGPIIKLREQSIREVRFSVVHLGSINAFENGNNYGLTGIDGAIKYLTGKWFN